jgi:glycosyltransferase involved in cell wall biosynthesis
LEDGYGIQPNQTAVVRNGVDLSRFQPQGGSGDCGFTVAYAGGFQIWQGIENLVEAAERIADPLIKVKVIGFTPGDAALKRNLGQRLGKRAVLLDRMSQQQLIRELSSSDVLIIPRPASPVVKVAFPTKFAEYLALGKPVIVCEVDETAKLVRQHHCGFVALPNPDSIAQTINLARQTNVDRLRTMGANGRQLAEHEFSWDVIGERYHQQLIHWSRA